jgi:hypothetical protein
VHEDRNAGGEPIEGEPIETEDPDLVRYTSSRPADGVIPSGYGTSGGFIPRKDDAEGDREESPTDDHG